MSSPALNWALRGGVARRKGWRRTALAAVLCGGLAGCAADEPVRPLLRPVPGGNLPDVGKSFGATWADADGDGRRDLFVGLHGQGTAVRLARGGLRFAAADSCRYVPCASFDQHGIAAADADGDGLWDLYVTAGADRGEGVGENHLWRGRPGGGFAPDEDAAGLLADPRGRGRGAVWFPFDGDRFLELFVFNFRSPSRVFRCDGGAWTDIAERVVGVDSAGVSTGPLTWFQVASAAVGDLDRDGAVDLIALQDGGLLVLRNLGGRELRQETAASGLPGEPDGLVHLALGDLDDDGDLDLVTARRHPAAVEVWLNASSPQALRFVPGPDLSHLPWGFELDSVLLADFDNDGRLDLFVMMQGEDWTNVPDLVARGLGEGRFEATGDAWLAADAVEALPRGAWPIDLDRDGDLDLVTVHGKENFPERRGLTRLHENTATVAGLTIELETRTGPAHGLGARVELVTAEGRRVRQVRPTVSHWNSTVLPVHFGLGGLAGPYRVEVVWPGGQREAWVLPGPGRAYLLREGDPQPMVLAD